MSSKVFETLSDGRLASHTSFGCYPIFYLDRESSVLCADCAQRSLDEDEVPQFRPVDSAVHWEGPSLTCGQCGEAIESAYGDPDEPEIDGE